LNENQFGKKALQTILANSCKADPQFQGLLKPMKDVSLVKCVHSICHPHDYAKAIKHLFKMIDSDPKIYFTSGFHPAFAPQFCQIPKDTIETLIQHPKNVAIGEIGLDDLNHFSVPLVKQELAFIGLMKLAKKYDQPVVLHLATKQQSTYQIFRDLVTQHLGLNYKVYFHCSGKMRYKWLKELVSLFPRG
jgi:TatD DNase family protein